MLNSFSYNMSRMCVQIEGVCVTGFYIDVECWQSFYEMTVIRHCIRVIFSCVRGDFLGFTEIFDLLDFFSRSIVPLIFDDTDNCNWEQRHCFLGMEESFMLG